MTRARRIADIIARDDEPTAGMTPKQYRAWLKTLNDDDLKEFHRLVKKYHPKKN